MNLNNYNFTVIKLNNIIKFNALGFDSNEIYRYIEHGTIPKNIMAGYVMQPNIHILCNSRKITNKDIPRLIIKYRKLHKAISYEHYSYKKIVKLYKILLNDSKYTSICDIENYFNS